MSIELKGLEAKGVSTFVNFCVCVWVVRKKQNADRLKVTIVTVIVDAIISM